MATGLARAETSLRSAMTAESARQVTLVKCDIDGCFVAADWDESAGQWRCGIHRSDWEAETE